ncbi:hypothetical protein [Bacillus sp. V59.32b]|uniref:hypothetical protein n=1 Tax=Bacillus sp. V59.32b TaxID=1758642 RepID=UPI000E3D137F|nr:hypothetical protein [Bacillus sp. V59.32b]RFU67854.1 hypothetical protein D0463_06880 [Bacillus sp. V59.32b]
MYPSYPNDQSYPLYPGYSRGQGRGPQLYRSEYAPIDISLFSSSVHTFQLLMQQSRILLERLRDPAFEKQLMGFAQQGKQSEVDLLIRAIGLQVPVKTTFTPSEIIFSLRDSVSECCILTFAIRWGN